MDLPKRSVLAQEKSEPPKKRARRAPAAGAANDCFTCQERQMKCDRGRPYCSQCLEHDKSCSGYKTALTWNIGVASRGKLRGLALPIATSEKVSRGSVARGRKRWIASNRLPEPGSENFDCRSVTTSQSSDPSAQPVGTKKYSFVNMDPTQSATSLTVPTPGARCRSAPQSEANTSPRVRKRPRRHSSEPLLAPYSDQLRVLQDLSFSVNDLGLSNEEGLRITLDSPPPAPLMAASESYRGPLLSFSASGDLLNEDFYPEPEPMGWLGDNGSGLNLDPSITDYPHQKLSPTVAASAVTANNVFLNQDSFDLYGLATSNAIWGGDPIMDSGICGSPQDQGMNFGAPGYAEQLVLGISQPPSFQSGQASNLRCLIDYYDRVIPPVSTTFSSSTHPYKTQILRLAARSEALQHAIAALAANYMRQRCACARPNPSLQPFSDFFHDEFVRKYSSTHNMLDAGRNQIPFVCLGERLDKEFYFKEISSGMLNEQLGDLGMRKDGSLRAAILILCLDYVCGMGLANLKHRFASLTKILSLHGDLGIISIRAMTWLAIMFTWFDAMILAGGPGKKHFMGSSTMTSRIIEESWRERGLAGCNGKLFSMITKLGRLNLANGDTLIQAHQAADLGFGQILTPADNQYDFHITNPNQADENRPDPFRDARTDQCTQFWRERNEIRAELAGWRWDRPVKNSPCGKSAPLRHINSFHVSESFRCAALLYIEFLTSTRMAGMQSRVRSLVKRVAHHVSTVEPDVSLLLPLFIAGLDDPSQQTCHLMGEGCLDLLEDSEFLKNVSALDLSLQMWRGTDGGGEAVQGFTTFDPSIPI